MLDCRRSESRRRLGSAIDDREVPGVMTEFVQQEHHLQLEEAQLACTRQTSVRDRVTQTRNRDEVQNILTETRAQRNNESLANAATVFTHSERVLTLSNLVMEQLSQFYKTSVKVSVESVQCIRFDVQGCSGRMDGD